MADKKSMKAQCHDAAGYETDYQDFSDYDDGYGNRVDHGDLSVQKMVERGLRHPPHGEGFSAPVGYDKHPYTSKSQHRLFRAKESRGELPKGTSSRWMKKTKNYGKLPEKK
jgi:hypothetical protein